MPLVAFAVSVVKVAGALAVDIAEVEVTASVVMVRGGAGLAVSGALDAYGSVGRVVVPGGGEVVGVSQGFAVAGWVVLGGGYTSIGPGFGLYPPQGVGGQSGDALQGVGDLAQVVVGVVGGARRSGRSSALSRSWL